MRKSAVVVGTLVLAMSSMSAFAQHRHGMSNHGGGNARTCDEMNVNFDDRDTFKSQETFTMPAGQLDVTAAHNGGVSLVSGDGSQYQVQVCKFVAAENQSEANQLFSQIQAEK